MELHFYEGEFMVIVWSALKWIRIPGGNVLLLQTGTFKMQEMKSVQELDPYVCLPIDFPNLFWPLQQIVSHPLDVTSYTSWKKEPIKKTDC